MVTAQQLIQYPPLDSLFDAERIKGMASRRVLAPSPDVRWTPRVHGTPYDTHQDWMVGCGLRFDRFLFFSDTGLGKTKSALDLIDYHFTCRGAKHALVITGNPTATFEWADQAEKYIAAPVHDVQGTPAQRREQLLHFPESPIVATDYYTLKTAFAVKEPAKRTGGKGKMVPDMRALYAFGRMFDIVILDEIHQLKNPGSLRSQMVFALVTDIAVRYGLTGTPFDRHPEDAWAQFYLIDGGETFKTRQEFLGYFFREERSHWSAFQVEHRLRKEKKDEFKRRVRHRGMRITVSECAHMPEVVNVPVHLRPTQDAVPHILAAQARIKQAREQKEQHSEFAYLRQLCAGLLRVKNEDEKGSTTLRLSASPKLVWLLSFLEALPEKEQVVVFYEFRESGNWANEELTKNRHKTSWLYGGMTDERAVLEAWLHKKTRILLAQTQKAAESLNLQQAAYLVFYESPTTWRAYKQASARVGGRIGARKSFVYELYIKGSVEERVLKLIREGKNISASLLEQDPEHEQAGLFERPSAHRNAVARPQRVSNR